MTSITWINITVRLGDLKPWADNPRLSTKKQAQKILDSWKKFGQTDLVKVSPDLDVYDGHQRLSALLTIHNQDYVIEARQSSRHLTEAERREFVITHHAGAVGSWDWNELSSWQPAELLEWGFDESLLRNWRIDSSALGNFLGAEQIDYSQEWQGMPEFERKQEAFKTIHIHFRNEIDIMEFSGLIGQSLTLKTTSLWYPEKEINKTINIGYISDES